MLEILSSVLASVTKALSEALVSLVKNGVGAAMQKIPLVASRARKVREFEQRYLADVVAKHELMPLLPTTLVALAGGAHNQELDDVYVSLSIDDGTSHVEDDSLAHALRIAKRAVLLGDPGSGKTTTTRFLTLTMARAGLRSSRFIGEQQKDRISASRQWLKSELNWSDRPMPVFLYLNRLHDICTKPSTYSIAHLIAEDWPESLFQEKLASGDCVFIFDGLDELVTREARDRAIRLIGDLTTSAPHCRFVVTSRSVGYDGQLAAYGFKAFTIRPLSWDRITRLIRNWYKALGKPDGAEDLIVRLDANKGIRDLAINPMLLSLIALVQYTHGLIPDRRHILYEECVKILLDRRFAPAHVQQELRDFLPSDEALFLLSKLAEMMHRSQLREIGRSKLEQEMIPSALALMSYTIASKRNADDLLTNISQRSQLLVERGLDQNGEPLVGFSHLSFQEYLAALQFHRRMSTEREANVTKDLLQLYRSNREWWEEVCALYAAQLQGPQRKAFMQRFYPEAGT